jgi:branched-chain amino acid transport system permease protein
MVAVGGIGSVFGVIIGTALLTLMPDLFRFIGDYKLLVYGTLLFAVMRFAPEGLAGLPAMLLAKGGGRTGGDP